MRARDGLVPKGETRAVQLLVAVEALFMLCSQPCSLLMVLMVMVQYPMHTSLTDNTVIECANDYY